jgi:hypothetical protein
MMQKTSRIGYMPSRIGMGSRIGCKADRISIGLALSMIGYRMSRICIILTLDTVSVHCR